MIRRMCPLVVWFMFAGTGVVNLAHAQKPENAPPPAPQPGILDSLPQVADQPGSLYQPAPAQAHGAPAPDRPYFTVDPLLDPPQFPPGWFFTTEAAIVAPHVGNHLVDTVVNPRGVLDTVSVPSTELPWTVSPRFEAGYRLPSGFGELSLGYRFMISQGSDTQVELGQSLGSRSRLDVNQFDLNYASQEFSLWPNWDMKWGLGVRLAYIYFDAQTGLLPSGGGAIEQRITNSYSGAGPRAGLELARCIHGTGLAFVARLDLAALMGRIRQGYSETFPGAGPPVSDNHVSSSQTVPTLSIDVGLGWNPPDWPGVHFFAGYQYEHWWNVGRLGSINTMGDLIDQGILLRGGIDF